MRDSKFRRVLIWVMALFALSLALIPTIAQADELTPVPTTEVPTTADSPVADSPPVIVVNNSLDVETVIAIVASIGMVALALYFGLKSNNREMEKRLLEAAFREADKTRTPADDLGVRLVSSARGWIAMKNADGTYTLTPAELGSPPPTTLQSPN